MNHDNGIESVTNVPDDRYFFHNFLAKQTKQNKNMNEFEHETKQKQNEKRK